VSNPEPLVSAYVCRAIVDCLAERIVSVDELEPGENNAVYKVAYRNREGDVNQVLVRLGPQDEAGRIRAEREAVVLEKVGGVAGPRLYGFSAEEPAFGRPVMCLEFLQGDQPDLSEVGPANFERLGRLVRWLHAQPVDDLEDWAPEDIGLSDYVSERWRDHFASRLGAIRDPLPSPVQERLTAAVGVAAAAVEGLEDLSSGAGDQLVLLHADISGANLLRVPEPVLIDWEYARLGDPADEIAYLFTRTRSTSLSKTPSGAATRRPWLATRYAASLGVSAAGNRSPSSAQCSGGLKPGPVPKPQAVPDTPTPP
jgi:aminoglycoside phosphotransferase (APT) family kinase protein